MSPLSFKDDLPCARVHRHFFLDKLGRKSYHVGMKATVSQKGQVTIPKPLRERLGIRPGSILDFRDEQGRLVATKMTALDPVETVYGILKLGRSTDDLITSIRVEADARQSHLED
jgi:AbrB family looped-hinge helix DNA binding protein